MGIVKMPFSPKAESSAPLRRCIERTARSMGMSEHSTALLMSHFLENIVLEVASGNAVSIPGFAIIAPVRWESRSGDGEAYATPRFCAAIGFKNEVKTCCSSFPRAERAFQNYRCSHRSRKRLRSRRSFTTQKAFRDRIEADARRQGIDPKDCGS